MRRLSKCVVLFAVALLASAADLCPAHAQTGPVVNAIATLPDNRLLVGGSFTQLAGTTIRNLARILPNGSVDPGFRPEITGEVHAIAVQLDGRYVIGGSFTHVNGVPRNNIARLDAAGALDAAYNPDVGGTVFAFAWEPRFGTGTLTTEAGYASLYEPHLLVGGNFARVGANSSVRGFARLTHAGALVETGLLKVFTVTGLPPSITITSASGTIHSLLFTERRELICAGSFQKFGVDNDLFPDTVRNCFSYVPLGFPGGVEKIEPGGQTNALAIDRTQQLWLGGAFTGAKGTNFTSYAYAEDVHLPDPPAARVNGSVSSIALQSDGRVLIGGAFSTVQSGGGGPTFARRGLARILADGTVDTAFSPTLDGDVVSLTLRPDGVIAVGGRFATVNGASSPLFALLANGPASSALGLEDPGTTDPAQARLAWRRDGAAPELSGLADSALMAGQVTVADPGGMVIGNAPVLVFLGGPALLEASGDGGATWDARATLTEINPPDYSFFFALQGLPNTPAAHNLYRRTYGYGARRAVTNGMSLRARGITSDGGGSVGWVEQIGTVAFPPDLRVETLAGIGIPSGSTVQTDVTPVGASSRMTLRLRNTGLADITQLSLSVTGTHAAQFTVPAAPTPPAPLAASGGEAVFVIGFTPLFDGTHNATVRIASNDPDQPIHDVVVQGRGALPVLRVETLAGNPIPSGGTLSLGKALEGHETSLGVRIASIGSFPITNLVLSVSGPDAGRFSVQSGPTPPAPLAAVDGVSEVVLRFSPLAGGGVTSLLHIASNDPNRPDYQVVLSGQGLFAADDEDADGLSNGAEHALSALGFDYLLPNPDLLAELRGHGLYRASDFQVLAGEPLRLAHDTQSNQYKLTFGLRRGTNLLSTFEFLPLTAPQVQLTPEGRVELRFTDPAAKAFYYIDLE